MDKETNGKTRTNPTVDREAVRVLAIELGAREAARRLGIKESTVLSWARRYGWNLPRRKGGGNGKNAIALAIKPGDALIAAHEELEDATKTGLMQALAKAAQQVAGKDALDISNTAQLRDICLAAARIFGWKGDSQVNVAVNADKAAVVISPEKRAELQERLRRWQEERREPSVPAANTPTLPAPQVHPEGSTEAEAIVVADTERSVIATAQDPPNPLFLQGWEKEPELPRRSTRPHSRGWWY